MHACSIFNFILQTTLPWIFLYPKGIKDFMLYIKSKYNNPAIYITENGKLKKVHYPS